MNFNLYCSSFNLLDPTNWKEGNLEQNGVNLTTQCIILLGGSFDPVHVGHVALGRHFCDLFKTHALRLIPTGTPWQKLPLKANPQQRIAMLKYAFEPLELSITIDTQEINRPGATYTIDTLRSIRDEVGPTAPIIFLMGTDQLFHLNTWHQWKHLFNLCNIAVSTRPGFPDLLAHFPKAIVDEFSPRLSFPKEMTSTPAGLTYFSTDLHIDISATTIRTALQNNQNAASWIPTPVLRYIKEHNLYIS